MSAQPPYLLFLNVSPRGVSDATWAKWFLTRHLPDLLQSHACTRVALYREVSSAMLPNPIHPLRLLALYYTDLERLQNHKKYEQVSLEEDADVRNYKLIQDFDPKGVEDAPSPTILTTEMNPLNHADFEDWYRTDLLPRISRLPGYRRSKRYQLSAGCENSSETFLGSDYLAVHELEDLDRAFVSERQHLRNLTRWTKKQIRESEMAGGFVRRGWRLVWAEGW